MNRVYLAITILILLAVACGRQAPGTVPAAPDVPSGAFVVEAASSASLYLANDSAFARELKQDGLDLYTSVLTTGKIKNHMVDAVAEKYNGAQAFIVESPAWIPSDMTGGTTIATSKMVIGMTPAEMTLLGLTPGQIIPVGNLVQWINSKAIDLMLCNPSQCNDGFLFYSSMLMHFSGQTSLDINLADGTEGSKQIVAQAQALMNNLVISTATSGDAREAMYKSISDGGAYNAFWSYEPEIATLNTKLVSEGKSPLYVVYVEGAIDAAQTLVMNPMFAKNDAVKANFDKLVAFLIGTVKDNASQTAIGVTGWRPSLYRVPVSMDTLKTEWGFQAEPMVSTSFAPRFDVAMPLLRTYVSDIRKPIVLIMLYDRSGSMASNGGTTALFEASRYLFTDAAAEAFLEARDGDVTQVFLFDLECRPLAPVFGVDTTGYANLLNSIEQTFMGGNTAMYSCGKQALKTMAVNYKPFCDSTHNCAIVLMTDGGDNECKFASATCTSVDDFNRAKNDLGLRNIPVWAVPFGNTVDYGQINAITGVKVCTELIKDCFEKIKGSR